MIDYPYISESEELAKASGELQRELEKAAGKSQESRGRNTSADFYNFTGRVLKLGECCESITYTSAFAGTTIGPSDLPYIVDVTLFKENSCGELICLNKQTEVPVNSSITYSSELLGDGKYIVYVEFYDTVRDEVLSIELNVCANCCDDKRDLISSDVENKMACISCSIQAKKKIGRKTIHLENDYLNLSNTFYLLDSVNCVGKIPLSCDEVELIKCSIKKIK